jgi:hypothetical protein
MSYLHFLGQHHSSVDISDAIPSTAQRTPVEGPGLGDPSTQSNKLILYERRTFMFDMYNQEPKSENEGPTPSRQGCTHSEDDHPNLRCRESVRPKPEAYEQGKIVPCAE